MLNRRCGDEDVCVANDLAGRPESPPDPGKPFHDLLIQVDDGDAAEKRKEVLLGDNRIAPVIHTVVDLTEGDEADCQPVVLERLEEIDGRLLAPR